MDQEIYQQLSEALCYCRARIPTVLQEPPIGIICGSGLNDLANTVLPEPRCEISYANIPHFPLSTGNPIRSIRNQSKGLNILTEHSFRACRETSLWNAQTQEQTSDLDAGKTSVSPQSR